MIMGIGLWQEDYLDLDLIFLLFLLSLLILFFLHLALILQWSFCLYSSEMFSPGLS